MKDIVYYYKITTDEGIAYKYLINDVIIESPTFLLNYKYFAMNDKYTSMDSELYRFRDDLHSLNNEIKQHLIYNPLHKTHFKIDLFLYNSINSASYKNLLMNIDQSKLKEIDTINFREFAMMEKCKCSGLMTFNKKLQGETFKCYTYDFKKFYYEMLKRISIPCERPKYTILSTIDFNKLGFGIYRCMISCSNKRFFQIFNFNKDNHYTHTTLRILNKYKDMYGITFTLLPPDDEYNYNFCDYGTKTISLKIWWKHFFNIFDKLLSKCSSNWLLKSYVSMLWGTLCKYSLTIIPKNEIQEYDWDHLTNIKYNEKCEYYLKNCEQNNSSMIDSDNAYTYPHFARIKIFLPEYCRMYMFEMISELNLSKYVIRCQTDSVTFSKPIDFENITKNNRFNNYYPIIENKSSCMHDNEFITFYNMNNYKHYCDKCEQEFKYDKNNCHACFIS